jgi:predicted GH43/DUF377 family glycosyl hydrolase
MFVGLTLLSSLAIASDYCSKEQYAHDHSLVAKAFQPGMLLKGPKVRDSILVQEDAWYKMSYPQQIDFMRSFECAMGGAHGKKLLYMDVRSIATGKMLATWTLGTLSPAAKPQSSVAATNRTPFNPVGSTSASAPKPGLQGVLTRFVGNPLIRNGPEAYDSQKTGPRVVLKLGPLDYRMWYEAVGSNFITQVGYATSRDGLTWVKRGPVMSPDQSSWEKMETSPNSVLHEGGTFKMWYHGGGYVVSNLPGKRLGGAEIGFATSSDGITWTKYFGNPVLSRGPEGSFDDLQVAEPRVLNLGTNGYRMYFTGQNAATLKKSLAIANSTDGITWTKYLLNPVIPPDKFGGWGGAIILNNGIFNLWHGTSDDVSGLEYKWSKDGINWNDGPSYRVLTPSGDPNTADYQSVGDSVSGYLDGSTYRIMYTGYNSNFRGTRLEAICLATVLAPEKK